VKFLDFLSYAAGQVTRKRMRAVLTIIGIAVGIAAVIGTVALGEGIRAQAIQAVEAQSDLTLIEVSAGQQGGTVQLVTGARLRAIAGVPGVVAAAPIVRDSFASERQTYLAVMGIGTGELTAVLTPSYAQGVSFSPGTNEVVLGADIWDTLRRYEGVRLGEPMTVLVRAYADTGSPEDQKIVLVPVGVLRERGDALDTAVVGEISFIGSVRERQGSYDGLLVRAATPADVFSIVDRVEGLGLSATGSFEEIESVNRLMDMVVVVLAFFAAVSLVVGALMIMTTMVTSVYERRHEIGIAMAVGASQREVLALILLECAVIGLLGGILGDILGIAFAWLIDAVGKPFIVAALGDSFAGLSTSSITLVSPILLLFGAGAAVGLSVLSGLYPARIAARQDPVEAIRSRR
jgi:putative ABC transport system permease protein